MADHKITLSDSQESALQYAFDLGTSNAPDLDSYAAEWLGSYLDAYNLTIPELKADIIKEAYLSDPDTAAALDSALAAAPVKPKPLPPISVGVD